MDEIEGGHMMLKGKIAVVTGGTRGIGYSVVKKYLENGNSLVFQRMSFTMMKFPAISARFTKW